MADASTIVIFGASGDLSHRKLIPALFNLYRKQRLPDKFQILGCATRPWDDATLRQEMRASLNQFASFRFMEDEWDNFAQRLHYRSVNFKDPEDLSRLAGAVKSLEDGPSDRLYYLATAPQFFPGIVSFLGRAGLVVEDEGRRCVVIEKPFGTDLASARKMNEEIHHILNENQIFRIDHYLGKETVQNLLVFRFANSVFEPLWNRNHIDHVQITVAEEVGVEHRAGYYDGVGVLRDMFQNHLLQLLTLIALEPPATYKADALRDEKVKVLRSIRPLTPNEVWDSTVRGQYLGYRDEPRVAPDSQTPTFGAVRFFIDNWRWQDVPFYLRSGKNLADKCTEIIIQFKCPPRRMFPLPQEFEMIANVLGLSLQPNEGIHLRFEAKVPDTAAEMQMVEMNFHYQDAFGPASIPEAYERLLMDALNGDPSLFIRADQAELAWELIDPIIAACESQDAPPLAIYDPGSFGPIEADRFLARDGRSWLRSCGNHP
jgi:glucose-6-phosphate 1-dehydrogenase